MRGSHAADVSTLLSEYRPNLRSALTDHGMNGVYKWRDESLDSAIKAIVQMGLGPKGVLLNAGGTHLDPEPATPDARGYLVFQAALMLIGGQQPISIKTRALQTRIDPMERALTVEHLRRQIHRLETQGDPHGDGGSACFGVWADLENALERTTQPEQTV
jgi:hypothetical protein